MKIEEIYQFFVTLQHKLELHVKDTYYKGRMAGFVATGL